MISLTYRRPFICVGLTGAMLVGQLTACTSWRVQNIPEAISFTVRDPAKPVRIVRRNGTQVTLKGARFSGDTLYGTPVYSGTTMSGPAVAIPLSDVRTIEVRQGDTVKTVGLVLAITASVAGGVLLWYVATCGRYCAV